MRMRRLICAVAAGLLLLTTPERAQAKDWWGWLEEFSGPGPFGVRKPWQTLHFTAICGAEDEIDYNALEPAVDLIAPGVQKYLEEFAASLRSTVPNVPDVAPLQFTLPLAPDAIAVPLSQPLAPPARASDEPGVRLNVTLPAEFLVAETAVGRRLQPFGTPMPFASIAARPVATRLNQRGIKRALAKPRLHRKYCVYVDYGRFFADADAVQGYPDIRASKLDVGLAYFIMGPLDISAAAGYIKFQPSNTPDVFRWTFTPLRVQVRPFAWVEKFAANGGFGRGLARLAYAPKLYVKQTALLGSIRASEFGSSQLLPDGSEFQTGHELVSSYGFALDLTEIFAAFFDFDGSSDR